MGYDGQTITISCKNLGFNPSKNSNAVPLNSMISDSKNCILSEDGTGKRGGTIPMNATALSGTPDITGLYQFKTTTGSEILLCGTSAGNIISNPLAASPTTLKSGISANQFYDFTTYNDDVYIIPFGSNTSATTSAAGTIWTSQNLPSTANWRAVAHNGTNLFCTVAYNSDKAATSADGVTWNARTLTASRNWRSIAWGSSKFVAIASGTDKGAYSADGISWTEMTLPASRNWQSVSWSGSAFCAVAGGDAGISDPTSTLTASIIPDQSTTNVNLGTHSYKVTFTTATGESNGSSSSNVINLTDSHSRVRLASIPLGPTGTTSRKIYRTVAGDTGNYKLLTTISDNTTQLYYDNIADASLGADINELNTDKCATSADGITWTERTMTAVKAWNAIAFASSKFVALAGGFSAGAYSADGITWTAMTLPAAINWQSVAWSGLRFAAIARGTSSGAYSADGITWTAMTLSSSIDWMGIAWGGTQFVSVGLSSGYANISTDGVSWSSADLPVSASRYGITYGVDRFVVVDYNAATGATSVITTLSGDIPQKWDGSATTTTSIGNPVACTAALAGGGAGNVNAGAHSYKVTFVTASGESSGSPASNSVTTTAGDGKVNLTAIQVGPTGTTSRKLYRTEAGGSTYKLLDTIANNTATTYADNIADASLTTTIPSSNTAQTIPTDWATYFPKQMIVHGYGNSERVWCFGTPTKTKWIYITPNNDGASDIDFSQANILTLYIETGDGYGLVGGVEFQDRLIAFGKRKAYVIDDSDPNTDGWGYAEAAWEGGAATHRLIVKTKNDLICMMDDGDVYSVSAAQQYGDYKLASLSRPHNIHTWIKDNIDMSYVEKFHAIFDEKLRAVRFFMVRQGQSEIDTCISYYVDRGIWGPPEDNLSYASGFNAACSALVKVSAGNYNIYTGDYSGFIWQLNMDDKHDNNNGYEGTFRLPKLSCEQDGVGSARVNKRFDNCWLVGKSTGDYNLTSTYYVDGDSASSTINLYDASGDLNKDDCIGMYGKTISPKFSNSTANQDFFVEEIMLDYKPLSK